MKPFHISNVHRRDRYGESKRRKAVTCVLCGTEPTRNKDGICNYCEHDWRVGRAFKNHIAEQQSAGDIITGILPQHPATKRYRAMSRDELEAKYPASHGWLLADTELMRTLIDMAGITKIGDRARSGSDQGTRYLYDRDDNYPGYYTGTREAFEALQKAYDLICFLLQSDYKEGYSDGNSIIARLAGGELTVDKLNELETKKGVKK